MYPLYLVTISLTPKLLLNSERQEMEIACQRNFESHLTRYEIILSNEKARSSNEVLEFRLSIYIRKTNDPSKYSEYLQEKVQVEKLTRDFYMQEELRGWKPECSAVGKAVRR